MTIFTSNTNITRTIEIAHGEGRIEMSSDGYTINVTTSNRYTYKLGLMAFRAIRGAAASEYCNTLMDVKATSPRDWEKAIAHAKTKLSSQVYQAWREIVDAAPEHSRVVQHGFMASLGSPLSADYVTPGSDIWEHPILAQRHAARVIYAANYRYRTSSFSKNWRAILDPQHTGYGALNKTLDALPHGIAPKALQLLAGQARLPKPIYDRAQLIAYCQCDNAELAHLIATADPESLRKAIAAFYPNATPRQLQTPSGLQVENAVRHMEAELNMRDGKPYHNDTPQAIMRRALNNDRIGTWSRIRDDYDYPGDNYEFTRQAQWPLPNGFRYVNTPGQLIQLSCAEHHCVASYWREAMAGRLEVYHVTHAGTTTTIGITNGTTIYQNRGTNNAYTAASAWAAKTLGPILKKTYQPTPEPLATAPNQEPTGTQSARTPTKRRAATRRTDFRNPNRPKVKAEYLQLGWNDGQARRPLQAKYNDDYLTAYLNAIVDSEDYKDALNETHAYPAKHYAKEGVYHVGRPNAQKHPLRWLCIWQMECENGEKFTFRTKREQQLYAKQELERIDKQIRRAAFNNEPINIDEMTEAQAEMYLEIIRSNSPYWNAIAALRENRVSEHIPGAAPNPAADIAWQDFHNRKAADDPNESQLKAQMKAASEEIDTEDIPF